MKQMNLSRYRNQAAIALKQIRKGELNAITRIQALDYFQSHSPNEIQQQIKLKHALEIIAIECGFKNWVKLKTHFEKNTLNQIASHYIGGYLNHWFATYSEAKYHLNQYGGYLLPFNSKKQQQFYICDQSYIDRFGFDPYAKQWKAIGFDLAQTVEKKARLDLLDEWVESRQHV